MDQLNTIFSNEYFIHNHQMEHFMSHFANFHDLKDASVFITGGGSGIGASLTEAFLEQSAKVALFQRSECSEFVANCEFKYSKSPTFVKLDITDADGFGIGSQLLRPDMSLVQIFENANAIVSVYDLSIQK